MSYFLHTFLLIIKKRMIFTYFFTQFRLFVKIHRNFASFSKISKLYDAKYKRSIKTKNRIFTLEDNKVGGEVLERLSASDTATLLGLKTPNLKHYAELLEQNGLDIYRDAKKHRFYTRENIKILKAMIYLNREKSMLLDDAASFVMSSDTDIDHLLAESKRDNEERREIAQSIENNLGTLEVLLSILNEQKAMREDFTKREQSQYEAMKAVEIATLQQNETIKEVLETVKQQTATVEGLKSELEAAKKEKELQKKSLFSRLFGS